MPICRFATAILVLLAATALPAIAKPEPRVRASHPLLVRLLAEGAERSATMRALVGRLDASDVIVHLEAAPRGYALAGGMQFVGTAAVTRYVRVTLRTDLPAEAVMALIGHELRHAVEVAENPEIRDEQSFRSYYQERGQPNRRAHRLTYDTREAVEAGSRVALELRITRAWRSEVAAK